MRFPKSFSKTYLRFRDLPSMTLSAVILTPDPSDSLAGSRWPTLLGRLANVLGAQGVAVRAVPWTTRNLKALSEAPLVMPLLVWGYHRASVRWLEALTEWEEADVAIANPVPVLRWNSDKRYLIPLGEKGVPVTPTRFVEQLTVAEMHAASEAFGSTRLVAKPPISATAFQTIRWSPGQTLDGGPDGPAMIQPYLSSVEDEGEMSLIFIEGKFSHALRKVAVPGDFRVQPEFGGRLHPWDPDARAMEAARRVLDAVEPLLYSRIDLVRASNDDWVLMEAELVEPDLYLDLDPTRGAMFADAVARRLRKGASGLGIRRAANVDEG